jgi:hypothetical protein
VTQVFENFTYVREIANPDGRDHAFVFTASVAGKKLQGCDFLYFDEDGKIDDFTAGCVRDSRNSAQQTKTSSPNSAPTAKPSSASSTSCPWKPATPPAAHGPCPCSSTGLHSATGVVLSLVRVVG